MEGHSRVIFVINGRKWFQFDLFLELQKGICHNSLFRQSKSGFWWGIFFIPYPLLILNSDPWIQLHDKIWSQGRDEADWVTSQKSTRTGESPFSSVLVNFSRTDFAVFKSISNYLPLVQILKIPSFIRSATVPHENEKLLPFGFPQSSKRLGSVWMNFSSCVIWANRVQPCITPTLHIADLLFLWLQPLTICICGSLLKTCEPNSTWLPAMSMLTNAGFGQFMVLVFLYCTEKSHNFNKEWLVDCVYAVFLDALDSMNNKLAIQLADKILKKQKDLHCAKVNYRLYKSWIVIM